MMEGKRNIIHQLLQEYDIETAEDIQDALKDLLHILVGRSHHSGPTEPPYFINYSACFLSIP